MNGIEMTDKEDIFTEYHIACPPCVKPLRIDKYLSTHIANVSRSRIQQAISAQWVKVNEKVVKSNYKVQPSDDIVCYTSELPDYDHVVPQDIPLSIIYEDDYLLVVNKSAGMVVHPGVGHPTGTLLNAIVYYLVQKLGENAVKSIGRYGLVHRIDKDTSGLLVVSKTSAAAAALSKQFFNHTVERTYVGLVWGDVAQDRGRIEGNIGRHRRFRKKFDVYPDGNMGKNAVTHYKLLERFGYTSLLSFNLETGRTHQIRVHMKWKGHPLFMDKQYGGDTIRKGVIFSKYKQFVNNVFALCPRQALHAQSLKFKHPHTGDMMNFHTELPNDISLAIDRWRTYTKRAVGNI